ncbi:beta-defensin 113 [Lepus europaeus]|uniref:beta-defensin 113 n=1 Tax=Lepus europaeus TaxID=9983 RepID=UPI002B4694CF|nr:beta-defensin 113 [Lepus europaeus]
MKILCIFMVFILTVSCGPADPQKKLRETLVRKRECYLVRGSCKTECNSWEYVYNHCDTEPCCVVREYIRPQEVTTISTTTHKNANSHSNI